jgi:lipopolysaccharide export system permease protein
MRLITRHILRSLAAPFVWGLVALTGLLLLNPLAPLIDQFGGKGLDAGIIVEAVVLTLPALLALSLPMAVLVSTLYAYSQLAADMEMVAMYANGISVWRMARPALLAAAVVAGVNFTLFDEVVPRSNARFSTLRSDVIGKMPTLSLRPQVLNALPPADQYTLQAADIDPVTGEMSHVTIYDLTDYDTRSVIVADSGRMAQSPNGTDLLLTLFSGVALEFKESEPGRIQRTLFQTDKVRIRNVENSLHRTTDIGGNNNSNDREMSGCELLDGADAARVRSSAGIHQQEYFTHRDLQALSGLPLSAAPGIQSTPHLTPHCRHFRGVERWFERLILPAPLHAEELQQPGQVPPSQTPQPAQVPQAPAPAGPQPVQQQPGPQLPVQQPPFLVPPVTAIGVATGSGMPTSAAEAENIARSVSVDRSEMLGYAVEYHKKFAIPLASFCFVLLGIALALKYPGSGIGLVIGASLVIFLGFYVLLIGGENVAKKGYVSPFVGIQAPLILLTAIGLVAVYSANREMGTARSAGLFASLAHLFRRLR